MASVNENPQVPSKKRSRTENWLDTDKLLLKELVRERVRAIENKNTDTNSNRKKKDAWADLHNTFNSLCVGAQRNITQLKNQWCFLKLQLTKEKSQYRRDITKTGGGPCPKEPECSQDPDDISSWLPFEFTVDSNEFDCDNRQIVEDIEVLPVIYEAVPAPLEAVLSTPEEVPASLEEAPALLEVDTASLAVTPAPLEVEDPLEESGFINNTTTNKESGQKGAGAIIKNKKLKLKKKARKLPEAAAETTCAVNKIMEIENKCRQELHEIQMENEKKRARNLDLEFDLLTAKLNYYKKQSGD